MKRITQIGFIMLLGSQIAAAQETPSVWTLQDCLDYAMEHNIQLRQSRNDYLSGLEDTREAKAARLPSLSASATQGFTNYPSSAVTEHNSYTGSYDLNASMTIYGGGKLSIGVKQAEMQNRIDALIVEEAANDIRIAIVQAYMQALYAKEAVEVARNTAEVSKAQRDRAEQMWQAGTVSKVDLAQFESQWAADEYQTVVAATSLEDYRLQLRQLLELDITEEMDIIAPENGEDEILSLLPAKEDVYARALDTMPEIARSTLDIEAAELGIKQARSGFLPSLSLSAGIGTGHISGGGFQNGSQIWNRFNENVGLSLSIPIFSNRKNKTAVNKARIAVSNSRLALLDTEKELLREVESAWLNAASAQSQYRAAVEKQRYAQQSYDLTAEQFRIGAKNTVELITAQNELSSARQEVLQAKYIALMNMELLDIYQGNEIK